MISKKAKTEPKHFWRYVKSKTKVKGGVSNLKNSDGQYISSNQHKAELLNDFFTSVFTKENLNNIPEINEKDVDIKLETIQISETGNYQTNEIVKFCIILILHDQILSNSIKTLQDPIKILYKPNFE